MRRELDLVPMDGKIVMGEFFKDGTRTASPITQSHPRQVRFIDSIHVSDADPVAIRF